MISRREALLTCASLLACSASVSLPVFAAEEQGIEPARIKAARDKAIAFLRVSQSEKGGWTVQAGPGVSGLVTAGLLQSGVGPDDPMMQKALKFLTSFVQPDGGLYEPRNQIGNYETSIVILALKEANADKRYDETITNAVAYVKKIQFDGSEGVKKEDVKFGGAGYGRSGDRPDLSNTAFLLDALKAAGVDKDDEAMKNSIVFVSRCQNLETEHNTTEMASKFNDGGFYYTPIVNKDMAGKGLKSYGSMTYAGLKSMIYAGLSKEDPRVKAAFGWIQKNYSVDENPGQGQSGLYYYFQTFGKTLHVLGESTLIDANGVKHDWRKDLGEKLISLQKENGSWVNSNPQFFEGDPSLATGFALLALKYCDMP